MAKKNTPPALFVRLRWRKCYAVWHHRPSDWWRKNPLQCSPKYTRDTTFPIRTNAYLGLFYFRAIPQTRRDSYHRWSSLTQMFYLDKTSILWAPSFLLKWMVQREQDVLLVWKIYFLQIRFPRIVIVKSAPNCDLYLVLGYELWLLKSLMLNLVLLGIFWIRCTHILLLKIYIFMKYFIPIIMWPLHFITLVINRFHLKYLHRKMGSLVARGLCCCL